MAAFQIELSREAERDLRNLPSHFEQQALREIPRWLMTEPYREIKTRVKRFFGFAPPLYRLRIGDYRAYYRIMADRVVILAILHKKDSQRWLKRPG